MNPTAHRARTWVITAAAATGIALGAAGIAGAATSGSTSASSSSTGAATAATAPDPSKGGHVANGITETLLTGDVATKVTDAAKAAVPGATVDRVENDAEGATYEAHMTKADGSKVTVKINADFSVAGTESGFGAGPGPGGQAPPSNTTGA